MAPELTVTVRFFAVLRERVGRSSSQVQIEPGATVQTLWDSVAAERPDLRDLGGAVRFAINGEHVTPETGLRDGDEVALLPPMSGG